MPRRTQAARRNQPKGNPQSKPKPNQTKPPNQTKAKSKDRQQDARIAALERKEEGPRAENSFKCTVNLGTVTDPGSEFSRVASVFLNPALLRDAEQSTDATTPLSVRASQYTLWRCSRGEVRAMPLVGNSGVAGTVALLTMQANAGHSPATTFDAVAARRHTAGNVGRDLRFRFGGKETRGPQHGWYYTNTATGPGQDTLGPAVEVYTLGACKNIYTNTDYTGPLWRLTLTATFEFANYQNNPELATLQTAEGHSSVTVTTTDEGVVQISPSNLRLMLAAPGSTGLGEVVLSLTESASQGLSSIPVLGPLLKTGVAFLRPLLQNLRTPPVYQVYPSFEAARLNQPLKLTPNQTHQGEGAFVVQQLTPTQNQTHSTRAIAPEVTNVMPAHTYDVAPIRSSTPVWFTASGHVAARSIGAATMQFTTTQTFRGCGTSWPGSGQYSGQTTNRWHWPGYQSDKVWRFQLVDSALRLSSGAIGLRAFVGGSSGLLAPFPQIRDAFGGADGNNIGFRTSRDFPSTGGETLVVPALVVAQPLSTSPSTLKQHAGYIIIRPDHISLNLAMQDADATPLGSQALFSGWLLPDYGYMPVGQRQVDEEITRGDPWLRWRDSPAQSQCTAPSPCSSDSCTKSYAELFESSSDEEE
uniref:Capsid protein n=1 Tax=Coleura bat astrovirus TaxID=3141863 RepID=A0AAU7E289_9VIRU